MPYPQGFQKAQLKFGSDTIECGFNPQDYTISKTNLWTYKPNQGAGHCRSPNSAAACR